MTNEASDPKELYAKSLCYFLAEMLRTRKIELKRAADIGQKFAQNVNLIDTEKDYLRFIKDMSSDFEELFFLGQRIEITVTTNPQRELETRVREFVASILPLDTNLALLVLEKSIKDDASVEALRKKFPKFDQFISQNYESPRYN